MTVTQIPLRSCRRFSARRIEINDEDRLPFGATGLIRAVAAFMLVVFSPAAVMAAPLRYCLGQNGHRAIELVHAKDGAHASRFADGARSLLELLRSDHHVWGQHCEDKVLFPVVAKAEKRFVGAPAPDPAIGKDSRFHGTTDAKRRSLRVLHPGTRQPRRIDPRLLTLKTVVLRN